MCGKNSPLSLFRICQNDLFQEDPRQSQRLRRGEGSQLDLIPFGAVAQPDDTVRWPSEEGMVMNVLGFREAREHAAILTVNGTLKVPVALVEAMLLLKLIAWKDRHNRIPGKDASDIWYILHHGQSIIGLDALYEEYPEAMEAVDWDLYLAPARVLGLRMRAMAHIETRSRLLEILNREVREEEDSLLVREVAAGASGGMVEAGNVLYLIQQVLAGLAAEPSSA